MASKKPETLFGEKFDAWLKQTYGEDVWSENIQQVSIVGTPDRLICIRGYFMAIELKKDAYSNPSPMQVYKLSKIANAGGFSFILHPGNFEEFKFKLLAMYPV